MATEYKICTHLDNITEAYLEPVQRLPGLTRNPKDIIRTIEFYTSSQYLSGNKDELNRDKPFYEISNYRVTTAKVATDIDVKDIKFEPESLKFSRQTMMINKELFKYLKECEFSKTLNDMGFARPKYGGVLVKKHEYNDGDGVEMDIEVVDWVNIDFDPADIMGGVIVETFHLQPDEFAGKKDVWENVTEVLKESAKVNKDKPAKIEIKEISGVFPETFDPEIEKGDDTNYKRMCFYVAVVENKKFFLYKEDQKKSNFKYLAWEAIGDGLGRGVVESGFEAQWAINDTMISFKNAMELSGKVLLSTNSKKVSGNAITDVASGHIFELEPNATMQSLNILPSAFPQFQVAIDLWNAQFDKVSSTYAANTGEAPTAGTPYSQTALLNQVANSPFEYQREVWGIFLNEILNDWILPYVKKRIVKSHTLVADYTPEELELIDEDLANYDVNPQIVDMVLADQPISNEVVSVLKEANKQARNKALGNKREFVIPAKWLDVDGQITANITGELKNKAAMLQSLDSVFAKLISTYNPQTGTFAALDNPVLAKLFGSIVEMAGIPFSYSQMMDSTKKTTNTPPQAPQPLTAPTAMQPDLTAINPAPVA
jgi:hypothetical protein